MQSINTIQMTYINVAMIIKVQLGSSYFSFHGTILKYFWE